MSDPVKVLIVEDEPHALMGLAELISGWGYRTETARDGVEGWEKALAGHKNVTIKSYAGLCHLFIPAGNPPSPADYDKPSHVARGTLDDIANWVAAQRTQ